MKNFIYIEAPQCDICREMYRWDGELQLPTLNIKYYVKLLQKFSVNLIHLMDCMQIMKIQNAQM